MRREIISGIYCIENVLDNKKYVGQSENIYKRWSEHRRMLNKNCHINTYLQNSWNKYGKENFKFTVLESCEIFKMEEKEIYWVRELFSHISENGYNISWGGNSPLRGQKLSEEHKEKLRIKATGRNHSQETKEKLSEIKTGTTRSRESVEKTKSKTIGRKNTEETKKKMSDVSIGKKKIKPSSSKYLGVYFNKEKKKWVSQLRVDGKQKYFGSFVDEIEAAKVYDKFIIENNLNLPLNFNYD